MRSIPYAGAAVFARLAARTLVLRVALWLLLALLVLAAAAAARHPRASAAPFVAPKAGGIVVFDLSASITSDTYARIHQTLQQLVARGGRYGLVVFSGSAYEALPPGTPAAALEPMIRYFAVQPTQQGEAPTFANNPWTADFTSGTEISEGLDLARRIEIANHVKHPAIVLISDLQDDANDLTRLGVVAQELKIEHFRATAIALNADPNDVSRFQQLFGKALSVIPAGATTGTQGSVAAPHTRFPTWLVILTVLVAALLGAAELRAARLTWGSGEPEAAT